MSNKDASMTQMSQNKSYSSHHAQEIGQKSNPRPTRITNNSQMNLEKQVADLELKVAYHERLNQDLSDQVYALHKEVEKLNLAIKSLKENFKQKTDQNLDIGPANEPPPHY